MLISLLSAKGSPGVTTAALALGSVWPRTALVVDVDPQGGDVLAGVGGGRQPADRGIVDVLTEARHGDPRAALARYVTRPAAHSPLLLAGFGAPGTGGDGAVDAARRGPRRAARHRRAGRLRPLLPPATRWRGLLRRSRLTAGGDRVVAARGARRRAGLPLLRTELGIADDDESIGLLVVDPDRPYTAEEIEQACRTEVVGTLPHDPAAAQVWTDAHPPQQVDPPCPRRTQPHPG